MKYTEFSSADFYTKVQENDRIYFRFVNDSNVPMEIEYGVSRPGEINYKEAGPIDETEVAAELKDILDAILVDQRKYLVRQVFHEKAVKKSKFILGGGIMFERVFCLAVVYLVHLRTVQMFEKKRRI